MRNADYRNVSDNFEIYLLTLHQKEKTMGKIKMLGALAGEIAECMYPISNDIAERCDSILTEDLREIKDRFCEFIEKRKG